MKPLGIHWVGDGRSEGVKEWVPGALSETDVEISEKLT